MCGIAGFLGGGMSEAQFGALEVMGDAIAHRGPDSAGLWVDRTRGIGLAHRRLAVVDLSEAGAQPMHSATGRYVLVFNGEIYNHLALRAMVEDRIGPQSWRGHADTETLLMTIETMGLDATLAHCTGMFAIALWDREGGTLQLARDRLGEKPLYYGWNGGSFWFASELRALLANPAFTLKVDRDALALYFRYGYVPAPYSIWSGIRKLEPGAVFRVSAGGQVCDVSPAPAAPADSRYWDPLEVAEAAARTPFRGSFDDAIDAVETRLGDAIERQMQADVPVGAFLSGGIDSSVVTALMQQRSTRIVQTYTIGFEDPAFDESAHAAAVARHLKTEHHETILRLDDALAIVPQLSEIYDEPFADMSQIPTYLVSKVARREVTVALSGDGGDELFGGYARYTTAESLARLHDAIPPFARRWLSGVQNTRLAGHGPAGELRLAGAIRRTDAPVGSAIDRFARAIELLSIDSDLKRYQSTMSFWKRPLDLVIGSAPAPCVFDDERYWRGKEPMRSALQMVDFCTYLPDCILAKVDRASMRVSLETRVPLLDHGLVELVWSLPAGFRSTGSPPKRLLKEMLRRHVPGELIERPKMGFGMPISRWLKGPLRAWADGLLARERVADEGFLNAARVDAVWREYLSGADQLEGQVWTVLMFQSWLDALPRAPGEIEPGG